MKRNTLPTKKEIRKAAYLLQSWSDALRHGNQGGLPHDETLLAETVLMRELSLKLYALARHDSGCRVQSTLPV